MAAQIRQRRSASRRRMDAWRHTTGPQHAHRFEQSDALRQGLQAAVILLLQGLDIHLACAPSAGHAGGV